jgi:hypothetical protein
MMQTAELEFPRLVAGERTFGKRSASPTLGGSAMGGRPCAERSEGRDGLSASLWLTSLQRPGVFEVVPTENISRSGIQMVTRGLWEPAELVLVSSPPGFCVQGSVVYCKKLPSDDYVLGISFDAPVQDWSETLGFGKS